MPGGSSVELFVSLAAELDVYIIFGCVEREEGSDDVFNTAFVCGPTEGYIGKFRKVTSEKEFVDGTEAPVFETRYGTLGIFICSDMRLPELARLLVLKGASMLFQPTNYFHAITPPDEVPARYLGKQNAQRARSIENGVPLICANAGRAECASPPFLRPCTQSLSFVPIHH